MTTGSGVYDWKDLVPELNTFQIQSVVPLDRDFLSNKTVNFAECRRSSLDSISEYQPCRVEESDPTAVLQYGSLGLRLMKCNWFSGEA